MQYHISFRASFLRILAVLLLIAVLVPAPAFSLDSQDSQIFISGFNAYQKKDYETAIEKMSGLLKSYPDTPLKDMAIFWLARANFKAGHKEEAGKYMAQFLREYPDSPLKGTVDDELLALAQKYQGAPATAGKAAKAEGKKPVAETIPSETIVPETAAEKAAAEQAAAEEAAAKAGAEKAAAEKVAAERVAAERAAAEKAAAQRAATERAAAQRATEKAAAERAAAEKAAAERAAAERAAAERAAAERAASERAAAERVAAEKAEAERVVAERAEAERAAADRAALAAREREDAGQAAMERPAELAPVEETIPEEPVEQPVVEVRKPAKGKKASPMREKAIAAYKSTVDNYPGTAAAAGASAKLRELGIEYPPVARSAAAGRAKVAQVFTLEVAQHSDMEVQVGPVPETSEVGKQFSVPIDIVNSGNGSDRYYLESKFPADWNFRFASASRPDVAIDSTPSLAVGERFRAVGVGVVPRGNIDGQKNSYPVKVVSSLAPEVSLSKEVAVVSAAPLLRVVVKSDKARLLPGERTSYRISLLNVGTAAARGLTLKVSYPGEFEPLSSRTNGFERARGALVLDDVALKSGESKDYNFSFQLKDDALADQELFVRADLVNNELDKKESFISAAAVVDRVSGVAARTTADKLVAIPGQTISIPVVVTNTGNQREGFSLKASVPARASYTFFADLNRDGKRQANEPIVNHVGPLSPKEEAYVVLEVKTPISAYDGAKGPIAVRVEPENAASKSAAVNLQLTYSRPIVKLSMAGKGGRVKPGEVSSLELNCVNSGSNIAKQVVLQSVLPSQLEVVAADPAFSRADNGTYTWHFGELGAGEKRSISVSYRVKPGTAVGTNMQLQNLLNYQDQLGNRY